MAGRFRMVWDDIDLSIMGDANSLLSLAKAITTI